MIDKPYGVAMHDGKIYVCDTQRLTLTILDLRKKEVRLLGATGLGKLLKPIAVAVAPDGMIYVADTQLGGVLMYGADEQYIGTIKHPDLHPVGLAVNQKELYVVSMMAGCVEVYDRATCKLVGTISKVGRSKGEVSLPLGVALDKDGNVYIDDLINCRVQRFTPDGKLSLAIGGLGDQPGSFARPKHLAVDSDGIIYVVDAMFQNVQMFNAKGDELMFFGGAGSHPGAMDLPAGICVDDGDLDLFQQYVHPAFQAERLIVVTNQFGGEKVSVYALGHLKPGKTVADVSAARTLISSSAATENASGAGGRSTHSRRLLRPPRLPPAPHPQPNPQPQHRGGDCEGPAAPASPGRLQPYGLDRRAAVPGRAAVGDVVRLQHTAGAVPDAVLLFRRRSKPGRTEAAGWHGGLGEGREAPSKGSHLHA